MVIFNTKKEAEDRVNCINANTLWKDGVTNNYATPIELSDGKYALPVLEGFEHYFNEPRAMSVNVKAQKLEGDK